MCIDIKSLRYSLGRLVHWTKIKKHARVSKPNKKTLVNLK